ncbi:MAG: hypothetical protein AB7J35_01050 [Dehalococcoidia bacterium]
MNPATHLHSIVRRILMADAALEAIVGVALLGLVGSPHRWMDIDRSVTLIAAGVFFVAAVGVLAIALLPGTTRATVQYLAFGNVAGGLAIWLFTALNWDRFLSEGHWFIGATADAFLLIGLLEFVALWRTQ